MGTGLTTFSNGATITGAELRTRHDEVAEYLNGGMVSGDLKSTSTWVEVQQIERPKFFGAPSPRVIAATADVYYKRTPHDWQDAWLLSDDVVADQRTWVPQLTRDVYVDPARSNSTCTAFVFWQVFGFDINGSAPLATNFETNEAVEFRLDRYEWATQTLTTMGSTTRRLFSGTNTTTYSSRKNHVVARVITGLEAGKHTIGVRALVNANSGANPRYWNQIYSRDRHFQVRLQYL